MPRTTSKPLTARAVETARHPRPDSSAPVQINAGGAPGLLLQITSTHAKSWVLRTWIDGKRRRIGLGPYPAVSLAEARAKALELSEQVRAGHDPIAERQEARRARRAAQHRMTFADAYAATIEARIAKDNAGERRRWRNSWGTYAAKQVGKRPVAEIDVHDIRAVLEPIWTTKHETAKRLRARMEAALAWAAVHGHRAGDNPARWQGNLDAILPRRAGKPAHEAAMPALPMAKAPEWLAALRQRQGNSARALEFIAYTAARSGEVRGATWGEVDLEAGLWIVPADRMKAGREHRVPLSAPALRLLRAMPKGGPDDLIFAAPRGGPLSDMSISAVMRKMQAAAERAAGKAGEDVSRAGFRDPRSGRPAVPHGMRSVFRDWCAEQGIDRDLAEIALAHQVGSDVERAYRRTDMFERRRAVMERWAAALEGRPEGETVVPLRA